LSEATPFAEAEDYPSRFGQIRDQIEHRLGEIAPSISGSAPRLRGAMRYSLLDGGKRMRPLATVVTTDVLGGPIDAAIDVGCAIEMVHTASLIIDDLPCMDDASERRGKPANHIVHGEDISILGAIALIGDAFGLIAAQPNIETNHRMRLVRAMSESIGVEGLCAGQERDLRDLGHDANPAELAQIQAQKTGALFTLCLEAGARIAGLGDDALPPLTAFGQHAGAGFQVLDDLLDVEGKAHLTGKGTHSDLGKLTYASVMTPTEAEAYARQELRFALDALEPSGLDSSPFEAYLDLVLQTYDAQIGSGRTMSVG
jgi:geranylgeranyl diphosphate synthase type II